MINRKTQVKISTLNPINLFVDEIFTIRFENYSKRRTTEIKTILTRIKNTISQFISNH